MTPCGEVILIGGDGSGIRFVDDAEGGLRPLRGYHGTLLANPEDRSFDFYSKSGNRWHYEHSGESAWRLERIKDPIGNTTTLAYVVDAC